MSQVMTMLQAAVIIRASNERSAMFSQSLKVLVGAFNQEKQGVRESARVPQLVMLCRRWAHLQCFDGRTGHTAGYCVAGKRAQYRNCENFEDGLFVALIQELSR